MSSIRRKRRNFLERERIVRESGVRSVFTPHTPVADERYLRGRETEVSHLVAQHDTPGQHGLLFGSRGVGKSSLAKATSGIVESHSTPSYSYRCDSRTTFEDLIAHPLAVTGVDVDVVESESENEAESGWNAGLTLLGKRRHKRESALERRKRPRDIRPSDAANWLGKSTGLLVIDEAEAAPLRTLFHVAEFIKQLSDTQSELKMLVVGVAETAQELTASHPSVSRCLMEVHVGPMADAHLSEIITAGAEVLHIRFEDSVVNDIVRVSRGYPHFTHLLALKCAEEVLVGEEDLVDSMVFKSALTNAYVGAEGKLRNDYGDAVRSESPRYRQVLLAASDLVGEHHREFTAKSLREGLSRLVGEEVTQAELNNYLRRLVSDDGTAVLTRTKKGVYCFSDPRMPSLVMIANSRVD